MAFCGTPGLAEAVEVQDHQPQRLERDVTKNSAAMSTRSRAPSRRISGKPASRNASGTQPQVAEPDAGRERRSTRPSGAAAARRTTAARSPPSASRRGSPAAAPRRRSPLAMNDQPTNSDSSVVDPEPPRRPATIDRRDADRDPGRDQPDAQHARTPRAATRCSAGVAWQA